MGNSCSVTKGLYFDVTAGDKAVKITDLKITTYNTRHMEVYTKKGPASTFEDKPCAWELAGETSPNWYSSWKRDVSPSWINGFKPVILQPGEKASIYLLSRTNSYGFCMQRYGSYNPPHYDNFIQTPPTSPVGGVIMSWGRLAEHDQPFKPGSTSYKYGIYGGPVLETVAPGSTAMPTMAPTIPSTPGSLLHSSASNAGSSNGLQFDVTNTGDKDVIVNYIGVPLSTSGSQHLDVWFRSSGSHEGTSSGCKNWNNWCNTWTMLKGQTVFSSGPGSLTNSPTFVAVIKAGTTSSFAITSPKSIFASSESAAAAGAILVSNDDLVVKQATSVDDYYGTNVQSSHDLPAPATKVFNIKIDYDIAHSLCAVLEKATWAKPLTAVASDSMGANAIEEEYDERSEIDEVVEFPNEEGGGLMGGGGLMENFE